MRALIVTAGTRGDVQPAFALAIAIRQLGHEVRLCVPPNFLGWASQLRLEVVAMGVEMRMPASTSQMPKLDAEALKRLRASMPDLIADQFNAVGVAAQGCDIIVGANAHQYAAPSIAESLGIACVTAVYAPVALPSTAWAPPPMPGQPHTSLESRSNEELWRDTHAAWNERALVRINDNRNRLGLSPIQDVLEYALTDRTWLAADAALAPIPPIPRREVVQTGAWVLAEDSALPIRLEQFLNAGAPPLYVGLGSMPANAEVGHALITAARALGLRVILSRGWSNLQLLDSAPDCIAIDDVNHQMLFPRVAAVVHHGGAGTTATAARAGVPQVITPMFGDQFYWASRVESLGVGGSVRLTALSQDALTSTLQSALDPAVRQRAVTLKASLPSDGVLQAARRVVAMAEGAAGTVNW